MTPDIFLLRKKQAQLSEVIDYFELELVDDPQWAEPSDTSYLNETDLADPDIVDNVGAMQATNKLIRWFGRDDEGYIGLWHGPDAIALEQAQVIRLDTEGQYWFVAATVPDYLAITFGEEEFDSVRQALIAAGFSVAGSIRAIWDGIDYTHGSPNDYRNSLYNQARIRRGLQPIEC